MPKQPKQSLKDRIRPSKFLVFWRTCPIIPEIKKSLWITALTVVSFFVFAWEHYATLILEFIKLAIPIEIAIAGFSIAILVLFISILNNGHTCSDKEKEYWNFLNLPLVVALLCVIGSSTSTITYIGIVADMHTLGTMIILFSLALFLFLSCILTFANLTVKISDYGWELVKKKQEQNRGIQYSCKPCCCCVFETEKEQSE